MQTQTIVGRVCGKGTSTPTTKQVRAILPQPAFLQVVDALLERKSDECYDGHFTEELHIHVGAMRGTQVLDIAHSLSLILEKSGDRRSRRAVAQFDLATYYVRHGADVAMRAQH